MPGELTMRFRNTSRYRLLVFTQQAVLAADEEVDDYGQAGTSY
jgi:hypothetical protein